MIGFVTVSLDFSGTGRFIQLIFTHRLVAINTFLADPGIMSAFLRRLMAVCQSADSDTVHCQGQLWTEREDWESVFSTAHLSKFAAFI